MTRTAHLGFGPIGQSIFELVRERRLAKPVGIADIDTQRISDLAESAGWAGVPVVAALADLPLGPGDVVVQCTGSRLETVAGQLREALALGASVISTCEELSYPWLEHAELAAEIDALARDANAVVVATGVNPGFMMDALPMFLSVVTRRVNSIRVTRVLDAARRRGPLQRKVGAGLSRGEFDELAAAGRMGHVGLRESAAMLAAAIGLGCDEVTEGLEPVIAERAFTTEVVSVSAGAVAGIHQVAIAWREGAPVVTLDLSMYVGAEDEVDRADLEGEPTMSVTTHGVHGDVATAAVVANLVGEVTRLQPGLRTMIDLVPVRAHPPSASA